ncbi:ArnT family glycosyltransferase [Leeuwenhoekiella sp. MAR_2009_132]|uniref:ArnT family glycosyltransferase n=1 Tax=Leeuwenhoekiella sp. MAR_2009_132 TaxID=1392489 RepID=UPI00068F1E74|nr:glycosyltransferase family 39 protein [Leeuwenhoekiella sp. MAR_2009_132]
MKKSFYLVLLFLFVILNIGQGSWGLTESSEARYAEIGREMALSNDFLNPSLLGIGHYHKPPVTYAITALGYKIFGYTEYGARFFLSLALIFQLFLIYKIALIWFKDEKTAIASSLIYFSFPIVLIATRNLTTDAYLTTFIIFSVYLWLQFKIKNKPYYLYFFYVILGLAFLTKGPVSFLPVALFILCYKIVNGEKPKFSIHTLPGLILLLLVSGSWFLSIIINKPELWDYFIQEQIIDRSVNAETFHRDKPFWYYILIAPALCLPWLVPVVINLFKKSKVIKFDKQTKICGYAAIAILATFSLFSSKLLLYILPLYPFLALYFGSIFSKYSTLNKTVYIQTYKAALIILVLLVVALPFIPTLNFNWLLASAFALSIIVFGYIFLFKSKGQPAQLVLLLSTGATCFLVLIYTSLSSQNSFLINALKPEYTFIKQQRTTSDYKVLVYDNLLSSAPFYLGDHVITIYDTNFESKRDTRFEDTDSWKESYLRIHDSGQVQRFKNLMQDSNTVLLIKNKKKLPDSLSYLLEGFKSEKFKKYTVYY